MEPKRLLLVAEIRENLPLNFLLRLGGYEVLNRCRLDEAVNWLRLTATIVPCDLLVIDPAPDSFRPDPPAVLAAAGDIPILVIWRGPGEIPRNLTPCRHLIFCPPENVLAALENHFRAEEQRTDLLQVRTAVRVDFDHVAERREG